MAPGATIVSAGTNGTPVDWEDALIWALNLNDPDPEVNVVNLSTRFDGTENEYMTWVDRCVDYWVRERLRTVVAAAGNNDSNAYVTSPGKAWNVITVGAYDDGNTTNWADDVMALDTSGYLNPYSPYGDREKPEVVAVGGSVTTLTYYGGMSNYVRSAPGTSYSTPQVSGVAALIIDADVRLGIWPAVVKAIIMASAIHNIDGPSRNRTGPG